MNWIDLLGLLVLSIFFLMGLVKGFIREVLILAGIVVSFFISLHLMGFAASWVEKWVAIPAALSLLIGFVAVFLGLVVVFHIVGYVLHKIVRASPLSIFDRLGGGLLGLLKAGLIIFVILLLLSVVPFRGGAASQMKGSFMYGAVEKTAPVFRKYLRAAAPALLRILDRTRGKIRSGLPEFRAVGESAQAEPALAISEIVSGIFSTRRI